MKYFRIIFLGSTLLLLTYLFNSCGDTGVSATPKVTGITVHNLSPLITALDGWYEAWASFPDALDHGDSRFRTMGKFNVKPDGSLVDQSGNTFSLNAQRFPDLNQIEDVVISVEPQGDADTILNGSKILGGPKTVEEGVLVFPLSMNYDEILGTVADNLPNATAKYILAATSDTSGDPNSYKRGAWFTKDTLGQSQGLTVPSIPDTLDWVYEAWIIDVSTDTLNTKYDMGTFVRSNQPDTYQQCQITIPNWQVPGQEWTIPGCPGALPQITDLTAGHYKLYITLEPRNESPAGRNTLFNLVLFYGRIPTSSFYGEIFDLANTVSLPTGELRLAYATK